MPGLIDAHVHVESSKLLPAEFARVVVARGTTAVVCDPHEIANVLGAAGALWLLEASEGLPLRVYAMAPSCVPASALESPRGPLGPDEMAEILRHERAIGVAEVMDFPSVIAGDPDVLAKVALHPHVDGHAPGRDRPRRSTRTRPPGSAPTTSRRRWEEALEKRRRGLWVLLREASNARNLSALLELVRRHGPEYCAFCTDDREPDMLVREGHIDAMCRQAVAEGIAPEDALVMATLHPARCHGLAELGAIAPGFHADMALLDDLESFRAAVVIAGGAVAARDGRALAFDAPPVPGWVRDTRERRAARGRRVRPRPGRRARARDRDRPRAADHGRRAGAARGARRPRGRRPGRDLAKLAVIERHHATGRVGVGLVRGFGLRSGAFASTVAHDAHNIVVVGADDASMAACARRLVELGGGIAVADGGEVRGELALPVAGLLSEEPAEAVVERLDELVALLLEQGVEIEAPFMTLSFLALSVIPDLKLTDRGLVDVAGARVVPLVV